MSVFGKDVYTLFLHLTVNEPGIAYRLVVVSVDKGLCWNSKEDQPHTRYLEIARRILSF